MRGKKEQIYELVIKAVVICDITIGATIKSGVAHSRKDPHSLKQ